MNKVPYPIKFLNYFFFLTTYGLLAYTDAVYVSNEIDSSLINLKYVTLILGILFCFIQIINFSKKDNLVYVYELKSVLTLVAIFTFATLVISLFNSKFTILTIEEILKLLLPILYVFGIINTFSFKDIYNCMVGALFLSFWGLILEVGLNTFTIENVFTISFSNSYSPFESHFSAGASIAMLVFFTYFNQKPLFKYISLLFALLTFKRVAVLFAIFIFLLPIFMNLNKTIGKRSILFIKIFFLLITITYYLLLSPNNITWIWDVLNIDPAELTMGRSLYLEILNYNNYSSFGFGSTQELLGKNIEMDLIKIMLELSIFGLFIFIFMYWNIVGNKLYSVIYMFYVFVNLLTSHSLTNVFSWVLIFLIIGTINHKENDPSFLRFLKKNKKIKIKLF